MADEPFDPGVFDFGVFDVETGRTIEVAVSTSADQSITVSTSALSIEVS